jgi:phage portal protein BeeE
MPVEQQKSIEQIRAEFDAAQAKTAGTKITPLSEEGKKFIAMALSGNPQAPGKAVRDGLVQDGEFD